MPKIDIASVPTVSGSRYPEQFKQACTGRHFQRLGDAADLTQFGVNLVRINPGSASSLRHWHESEDEFALMLEGELVLIEDEGETIMRPGDAAGFKANSGNGHHFVNRSDRDGVFLVVGTRALSERAHYPGLDLVAVRDEGAAGRYTRKSGESY